MAGGAYLAFVNWSSGSLPAGVVAVLLPFAPALSVGAAERRLPGLREDSRRRIEEFKSGGVF